MRDDTKHATEVEQASRKVRATFEVDVGAHLGDNEPNTQDIERVKIGSNKICVREDPAKEKMVFSRGSSRAVFEIVNEELVELKESSIQCPSCFTPRF